MNTISLLVYIPQNPKLNPVHLLSSIIQQSQALEVIVLHDSSVKLPEWAPDKWKVTVLQEGHSVSSAWNQGLVQATGDYICFTTPDVFYHKEHFKIMAHEAATSQKTAYYSQCQFINEKLYSLGDLNLPVLQSKDWIGFILEEDNLYPTGALLFKRSLLNDEPFHSEFSFYTGDQMVADWVQTHEIEPVLLKTVTALPGRSLFSGDVVAEFKLLLEHCLDTYALKSLVPSYASLPEDLMQERHSHLFISQALENRGLQEIGEEYIQKHHEVLEPLHLKTVLWVVHDFESCKEQLEDLWQASIKENFQPVILYTSSTVLKHKPPHCLKLSQYKGFPTIGVYNVSSSPNLLGDIHNETMGALYLSILRKYQVDLVHMTSLEDFSMRCAHMTAHLNIPMVYSYLDHWILCRRKDFKRDGQKNCWGPQSSGVNCKSCLKQDKMPLTLYQQRTENAHLVMRRYAHSVLIHNHEFVEILERNGIDNLTTINTPEQVIAIYNQASNSKIVERDESFLSLFHQGDSGESKIDFVNFFKGCQYVMDLGCGQGKFLKKLEQNKIPGVGLDYQRDVVMSLQDQGYQVYLGKMLDLGRFFNSFDGLYASHVIEHLAPAELITWFENCTLSMRKGGILVIRTPCWKNYQIQSSAFWLDSGHVRPYPRELLKELLDHSKFEVLREGQEENEYEDNYIVARYNGTSAPLLNAPTVTSGYLECWQHAFDKVKIDSEQTTLLIGTHISSIWEEHYQSDSKLHAISMDLNEVYQIRESLGLPLYYSNSPIDKLKILTETYDHLIVQGVIETMNPEQMREFLELCCQKLNPEGSLTILTMGLDPLDAVPNEFWECLWNVRPYPNLKSQLQSFNFSIEKSTREEDILIFQLKVHEANFAPEKTPISLPQLANFYWNRSQNKTHITESGQLAELQSGSIDFLFLDHVLENIPSQQLKATLETIWDKLELHGEVLFSTWQVDELIWNQNQISYPVPPQLVEKIGQDFGFIKCHSWVSDGQLFWHGKKQYSQLEPFVNNKLSIQWEGNAFNYHSLSLVNREILINLLKDESCEVSLLSNTDNLFIPEKTDALAPIAVAERRPMLNRPDIVIRHQWPPNFEAPNSGYWVVIQPWEFGSAPEKWIYNFNKMVDELWVPSHFVRDCYIKSGIIQSKVHVVPNGVDTEKYTSDVKPLDIKTNKKFKFLFVGGSIHRKGIDILLKAYLDAFSASDDVALVIKEFGAGEVYTATDIQQLIKEHSKDSSELPEVVHLSDELSLEDMPALYNACDCLVHPYRGEGFGLPIAEAMACEKPVIVTNYGAALDFCNEENAYLISAKEEVMEDKIVDGFVTVGQPFWAVPDVEHLKTLLKEVLDSPEEAKAKGKKAREKIVNEFTWTATYAKVEERLKAIRTKPIFRLNKDYILGDVITQAVFRFHEQNYAHAKEFFKYALQIDNHQPNVLYNLGLCYLMNGEYEQSVEYFQQSLEQGEYTADLCYAMGSALEKLGDKETAQQFYEHTRQLEPGFFASIGKV